MHGKTSTITHDGQGVFAGLPDPLVATRYHSLVVEAESVPPVLEISARSEDGIVMGLRHRTLAVEGVQFHPESILTAGGHRLLANWLSSCGQVDAHAAVPDAEAALADVLDPTRRRFPIQGGVGGRPATSSTSGPWSWSSGRSWWWWRGGGGRRSLVGPNDHVDSRALVFGGAGTRVLALHDPVLSTAGDRGGRVAAGQTDGVEGRVGGRLGGTGQVGDLDLGHPRGHVDGDGRTDGDLASGWRVRSGHLPRLDRPGGFVGLSDPQLLRSQDLTGLTGRVVGRGVGWSPGACHSRPPSGWPTPWPAGFPPGDRY